MTYRLTTLLWAFAVVAASLTVFGGWGLLAAIGVLLVWSAWFGRNYLEWQSQMVAAGILAVIVAMLIPPVETARQAAQSSSCLGNLSWLRGAVADYHLANGQLPQPTFVRGSNNDTHSWRVELLPFCECDALHKKYNFNQAWNGKNNAQLIGEDFYACPTHGMQGEASYLAVTGPNTAWGDGEPRSFADITDGLGQTILLIDCPARGIGWCEPQDLTFDEAVEILTSPIDSTVDGHYEKAGWFYKRAAFRNVIMADRTYIGLRNSLPRELAVALLTADGGERVDLEELERLAESELDYGAIYGTAIFVVASLLPMVPAARSRILPQ